MDPQGLPTTSDPQLVEEAKVNGDDPTDNPSSSLSAAAEEEDQEERAVDPIIATLLSLNSNKDRIREVQQRHRECCHAHRKYIYPYTYRSISYYHCHYSSCPVFHRKR